MLFHKHVDTEELDWCGERVRKGRMLFAHQPHSRRQLTDHNVLEPDVQLVIRVKLEGDVTF